MSEAGLVLVISGSSGAGKTTLARRWARDHEDATFSVSCTTRALRGKEKDGIDYTFVDEATFQTMVEDDAFAEWAIVHGNHYGTPRSMLEDNIGKGRTVVLDIDVQGGEQVIERFPDCVSVLVLPPSMAVLEARLRGRGTDTDEVLASRMAIAREENARAMRSYRYVITNDELERAYADLEAIVRAEKCRPGRAGVGDVLGQQGLPGEV